MAGAMAVCAAVQTETSDTTPTTQTEPSRGGREMVEFIPLSDVFSGTERAA